MWWVDVCYCVCARAAAIPPAKIKESNETKLYIHHDAPPLEVVGGLRPVHGGAAPGVARVLVGQVELAGVALCGYVWWCVVVCLGDRFLGGTTAPLAVPTTTKDAKYNARAVRTHLEGLLEVEPPDEAALLLAGQRHLEQGALGEEPVGALVHAVVSGWSRVCGCGFD